MGYSTFSDDLGFALAHISNCQILVECHFISNWSLLLANLPSEKPRIQKISSIIHLHPKRPSDSNQRINFSKRRGLEGKEGESSIISSQQNWRNDVIFYPGNGNRARKSADWLADLPNESVCVETFKDFNQWNTARFQRHLCHGCYSACRHKKTGFRVAPVSRQICTPWVATVGAPKQWCLKRWGTTGPSYHAVRCL